MSKANNFISTKGNYNNVNSSNATYLPALTFPRFVLSVLVVIVHFGLHLSIFQGEKTANILNFMGVAISFFFFLSGFVLAYNYPASYSKKKFWTKRFARIYPSYLLSFICVFLLMAITDKNLPSTKNSIINALGLQSWNFGYALELNFPSWSLSVEFFFYLLFPFLSLLFSRYSLRKITVLGFIIWGVGLAQHIYFMDYLYDPNRFFLEQFILYFPLFHLSTFVAGFVAGKITVSRINKHFGYWPFLIATIGIFLFAYLLSFENPLRFYGHNGALVPVFALIAFGLSFDKIIYPRLIGNRFMVYLGELSYGIYIWQFTVFLLFTLLFKTALFNTMQFFIYLLSLIIFSGFMYRFFEKPMHHLIVKRNSKKMN